MSNDVDNKEERMIWMYDRGHWFKLPLKLRQRWRTETNYGRKAPSSELLALVESCK